MLSFLARDFPQYAWSLGYWTVIFTTSAFTTVTKNVTGDPTIGEWWNIPPNPKEWNSIIYPQILKCGTGGD